MAQPVAFHVAPVFFRVIFASRQKPPVLCGQSATTAPSVVVTTGPFSMTVKATCVEEPIASRMACVTGSAPTTLPSVPPPPSRNESVPPLPPTPQEIFEATHTSVSSTPQPSPPKRHANRNVPHRTRPRCPIPNRSKFMKAASKGLVGRRCTESYATSILDQISSSPSNSPGVIARNRSVAGLEPLYRTSPGESYIVQPREVPRKKLEAWCRGPLLAKACIASRPLASPRRQVR